MNRWVKHFLDGHIYVGSDRDVLYQKASWTRSQNTNLVKVELFHDNWLLSIAGPGYFWQSDTYEALVGSRDSQLVARRIERQIEADDRLDYKEVIQSPISGERSFCEARLTKTNGFPLESHVGQWIVLELNMQKSRGFMYFSNKRL